MSTGSSSAAQGGTTVLFLIPSLRRAGAEAQLVELVNRLDGKAYRKLLVTFNPDLALGERLDPEGIAIHHLNRDSKLGFRLAGEIASIIDRERVDIVHCTLLVSVFYGWWGRFRSRRKPCLVAAIHTTINRSKTMELYERFFYRWLLVSCRRLVFVCHRQAAHWARKYRFVARKSTVIYNGVDEVRYAPGSFQQACKQTRARLGIGDDAPVVACVAGFRPEKGHLYLINAFSRLNPETHLLLAGDGPERPSIERAIADQCLTERVHLLGNVDDIRPVLAVSTVTVLASTAVETFSMAALESMAMGVPVVATDLGGMGEAIKDGETGFVVPPADVPQLADALARVIGDGGQARAMGERARARVREHFNTRSMVEQTEGLFRELASSVCPEGEV